MRVQCKITAWREFTVPEEQKELFWQLHEKGEIEGMNDLLNKIPGVKWHGIDSDSEEDAYQVWTEED